MALNKLVDFNKLMENLKGTIKAILDNRNYENQFYERKCKYDLISNYVPHTFEEIISDSEPWFCHGLAFRMSTFSSESEEFFQRLNSLLVIAESLDGWKNESENTGRTWANNYDEFFQHLWMLQCVEYFIDNGNEVCFPGRQGRSSPDLKVTSKNHDHFYVECYVYSKWWFIELFIEEVISLIDSNLCLKRTYNLKPKGMHGSLNEIMADIGDILTISKLRNAKCVASRKSPYILYNKNGIKLLMKGEGEYQASENAHGDPTESANAYVNDIINSKQDKNDLSSHRPNLLLVNGLGYDFQSIFFTDREISMSFKSDSIDKLQICACGINERLSKCRRMLSVPSL